MKAECIRCGRGRTPSDHSYHPIALVRGDSDPGWYSGDDGEMCGQCMVAIVKGQIIE